MNAAVTTRHAELEQLQHRALDRAAAFVESQLRSASVPEGGGYSSINASSASSVAQETSHLHGLARSLQPLLGVLNLGSPPLLEKVRAVYCRRIAAILQGLCAALVDEARPPELASSASVASEGSGVNRGSLGTHSSLRVEKTQSRSTTVYGALCFGLWIAGCTVLVY